MPRCPVMALTPTVSLQSGMLLAQQPGARSALQEDGMLGRAHAAFLCSDKAVERFSLRLGC